MRILLNNKQALSIIEVMVAIFIFTLGISAVYMVISSTVNVNAYNRDFIIASNLAREQVELIRNVRDSNYEKFQKWNMIYPDTTNYDAIFEGGKNRYYKLENNFSGMGFPVVVGTGSLVADFKSKVDSTDVTKEEYRVCLNADNRYVYCQPGMKKTSFYRYIEIQKVHTKLTGGTEVQDALKVRSKVYWKHRGVHDTEIDTIITDWRRL